MLIKKLTLSLAFALTFSLSLLQASVANFDFEIFDKFHQIVKTKMNKKAHRKYEKIRRDQQFLELEETIVKNLQLLLEDQNVSQELIQSIVNGDKESLIHPFCFIYALINTQNLGAEKTINLITECAKHYAKKEDPKGFRRDLNSVTAAKDKNKAWKEIAKKYPSLTTLLSLKVETMPKEEFSSEFYKKIADENSKESKEFFEDFCGLEKSFWTTTSIAIAATLVTAGVGLGLYILNKIKEKKAPEIQSRDTAAFN